MCESWRVKEDEIEKKTTTTATKTKKHLWQFHTVCCERCMLNAHCTQTNLRAVIWCFNFMFRGNWCWCWFFLSCCCRSPINTTQQQQKKQLWYYTYTIDTVDSTHTQTRKFNAVKNSINSIHFCGMAWNGMCATKKRSRVMKLSWFDFPLGHGQWTWTNEDRHGIPSKSNSL